MHEVRGAVGPIECLSGQEARGRKGDRTLGEIERDMGGGRQLKLLIPVFSTPTPNRCAAPTFYR